MPRTGLTPSRGVVQDNEVRTSTIAQGPPQSDTPQDATSDGAQLIAGVVVVTGPFVQLTRCLYPRGSGMGQPSRASLRFVHTEEDCITALTDQRNGLVPIHVRNEDPNGQQRVTDSASQLQALA